MDPFQGRIFYRFQVFPRTSFPDDLGFIQSIDRLGERIVIRTTDATNRCFDTSLGKAL